MSKTFNGYSNVGYKLIVNIMLWMIFILVFIGLFVFKNNLSLDQNVPVEHVNGLVNWSNFWVLIISSILLFTAFSFGTHKSSKADEVSRGKKFMDLSLVECTSVLFNFGSLVATVSVFTQSWQYLLATVILYVLGILIHPKSAT